MKGTKSILASLALGLGVLASCSPTPQAPSGMQISVLTDFSSFLAATGNVVDCDFENQPVNGSSQCSSDPTCTPISNPLRFKGATFTDPFALATGFCSSPTCEPDPDNPSEGNIQLFLNPGGTIDFPSNIGSAVLIIEGIGDNPFQLRVTDSAGNTRVADGTGVEFGVETLGFSSPYGISRIEVLNVLGTGGPLALSSVSFGRGRGPMP